MRVLGHFGRAIYDVAFSPDGRLVLLVPGGAGIEPALPEGNGILRCRRATLRSRAEFADLIEHRIAAMSPGERQQFDRLLRLNPATKR